MYIYIYCICVLGWIRCIYREILQVPPTYCIGIIGDIHPKLAGGIASKSGLNRQFSRCLKMHSPLFPPRGLCNNWNCKRWIMSKKNCSCRYFSLSVPLANPFLSHYILMVPAHYNHRISQLYILIISQLYPNMSHLLNMCITYIYIYILY